MIPKVIRHVFSEIERRKGEAEFSVKASFLEIYNEQIIDLLDAHRNIKSLSSHSESKTAAFPFDRRKTVRLAFMEPFSSKLAKHPRCWHYWTKAVSTGPLLPP